MILTRSQSLCYLISTRAAASARSSFTRARTAMGICSIARRASSCRAFPYVDTVTWTKGLDEDGKPIGAMIPGESKDFLFCPGGRGGRNFNHSAYSPRTGWWYTTAFEICSRMVHGTDLFEGDVLNPNSPPHIAAFDPLTGKKQWSYPTRYWNQSSLLSTAGDLIFAGDLAGDVFALDARTGQKLWSFSTGGRIASSPVSFSVNGRQYVAVSSGGGSSRENFVPNFWPEAKDHLPQPAATLFVFALPERRKAPNSASAGRTGSRSS